jgi:hypothetical protein
MEEQSSKHPVEGFGFSWIVTLTDGGVHIWFGGVGGHRESHSGGDVTSYTYLRCASSQHE